MKKKNILSSTHFSPLLFLLTSVCFRILLEGLKKFEICKMEDAILLNLYTGCVNMAPGILTSRGSNAKEVGLSCINSPAHRASWYTTWQDRLCWILLSKHQVTSALGYTGTTFRGITLTFCVCVKPERMFSAVLPMKEEIWEGSSQRQLAVSSGDSDLGEMLICCQVSGRFIRISNSCVKNPFSDSGTGLCGLEWVILPPGAVLGGLLELEGWAGQGVPRQRPGGRGIHRACRHSVARGCCGEEGGGACTCLEEEVPGRQKS